MWDKHWRYVPQLSSSSLSESPTTTAVLRAQVKEEEGAGETLSATAYWPLMWANPLPPPKEVESVSKLFTLFNRREGIVEMTLFDLRGKKSL